MSKTYFISGGNRGIGFSLVREISGHSSNTVVATARDINTATELKKWSEAHSNVKIVQLDVSSAESVKKAAAETERILPEGLDVLISNAGIANPNNSTLESSDELFLEHFNVNTLGPIRLIRALKPLLDKKSSKEIAVVSSIAGSVTITMPLSVSAYGVSKAAINYLIRQLDREMSPEGYSVVLIHPGMVSSDMGNKALEKMDAEFLKQVLETMNITVITPDESASGINKNILHDLKTKHSGKFLSYDGSEAPW
ncbi:LANO_0D03598g1_1 [Lachancea nothofagi CBS 11611]|uniref:LANO_0D03598g1_1 n=1 Tax=Lachancea nothofagi CBS 11611 TaxID=1266666 RepID=A0A1G4JFE5_9SACH|nr:LANO_0D03598g1_1 [Lachancea nothofagi CBS 11611]